MPWRGDYRSHCAACGRARFQGERFSRRGKCEGCGNGRMLLNAAQLRGHDGPLFEHWRRAHARAVGAVLLDDLPRD